MRKVLACAAAIWFALALSAAAQLLTPPFAFAPRGGGGGGGATAYLSAVSTILPVPNGSTAVDVTIPNGSSARLTWDSAGAGSCSGAGPGFSTGGAVSGTATVSPTSGVNTYTVNCGGQVATAHVTVSGNLIDAAASYCAANGGGSGSSAAPWKDVCIQAAFNAASSGDTIFLAAGNWALTTGTSATSASWAASTVTFVTSVNLGLTVGAQFNTANFTPAGYNGSWIAAAGTTCGGGGCTLVAAEATTLTTPASVLGTVGVAPTTSKSLNLIGADSGNTFDVWGHVNNPNGIDPCPAGASPTITCVYTAGPTFVYPGNVGTSCAPNCGGYISFASCPNATVSRIFLDSTPASAGGGPWGLFNIQNCTGTVVIDNVRHLPNVHSEAAFYLIQAIGGTTLIQNSAFAEPSAGGGYSNAQLFQANGQGNNVTANNNAFYQGAFNPIIISNLTFSGNQQYDYADGLGDITFTAAFGWAGSGVGGPWAGACPQAGAPITGNPYCNGDVGLFTTDNLFYAGSHYFGLGGGVNDPGSSGGLNDLHYAGNWIIADDGEINACVWSSCGPVETQPSAATCTGSGTITVTYTTPTDTGIRNGDSFVTWGFQPYFWNFIGTAVIGNSTTITATGTGTCPGATPTTIGLIGPHVVEGMTINTAVDVNCAESYNDSYGFNVFNNSIIGTTQAVFNEINTGGIQCRLGNPTPYTFIQISFYGFNAQGNYLSSPNNKYFINSHTINPVQQNNYCAGAGAAGLVTGCATSATAPPSGWTPPTCSFTLGTLWWNGVANVVNFASTGFTAQYGAVQWLASTSPTTPLSSDSRWSSNNSFWTSHPASLPPSAPNSYVPPTHLSGVSHGDTVYMWVMDSANHVSAAASAVVP